MVVDESGFLLLKSRVSSILGFSSGDYTDTFLMRRFDVRLRATNHRTYEEYAILLEKSETEQESLKQELTIHVTSFFRDPDFWDTFEKSTLPAIFRSFTPRGKRSVRIWSAGCSTGEEPLSIAACILDTMKTNKTSGGFNVRIIATDYDKKTIDFAKSPKYAESQFREMPRSKMLAYFKKCTDNTYIPKDELLSMIDYRVGDILKDPFPKNTDIIFCRNTVIYFNTGAKSNLYVRFSQELNDSGYLVLGKTECLSGAARDLFDIVDIRERIYRKRIRC